MSITVGVDLGARSYDIHVGRGLLERGGALAAPLIGEKRVFLVTDEVVAPLHAARLEAGFAAAGIAVSRIVLPAGGQAMVAWNITANSAVVDIHAVVDE